MSGLVRAPVFVLALAPLVGWLLVGACGAADDPSLGGAGGALAVVASSTAAGSSTFASAVGSGGAPPTFGCNPLTSEGCDVGATCDADYGAFAFVCYEGEAVRAPCEACGPAKGYCAAGATCFLGQCHAFCCDDTDCSESARCDRDALTPFGSGEVGLCRVFPEQGAGGGGGAPPEKPSPDCQPPSPAPSQGSCVPNRAN